MNKKQIEEAKNLKSIIAWEKLMRLNK